MSVLSFSAGLESLTKGWPAGHCPRLTSALSTVCISLQAAFCTISSPGHRNLNHKFGFLSRSVQFQVLNVSQSWMDNLCVLLSEGVWMSSVNTQWVAGWGVWVWNLISSCWSHFRFAISILEVQEIRNEKGLVVSAFLRLKKFTRKTE